MEQEVTQLREWWLEQASRFLIAHMAQHGLAAPSVRVSCGWPSRGGVGSRAVVIGQCFSPQVCADGRSHIFISPRIAESMTVLGTLLHELIHASVGCQHGHGKVFSQAARRVGLVGPPTATTVGDSLRPLLTSYIERAGAYPHAAIHLQPKEKVGSRLRLYQCRCSSLVKVRVASNDFAARCERCGGLFTQSS